MSITFDQKTCTFKLDTAHTTYMFQVLDGGYLCHLYWGGHIDAVTVNPGEVQAGVEAGKLKVLALMTEERDSVSFADIPTLKE